MWTTITATNITDPRSPDRILKTGTIVVSATNDNDMPIKFRLAEGGQVIDYPFTAAVLNGAIEGELQVPDSTSTVPANIKYHVDIVDGNSTVRRDKGILITGSVWDYDAYVPSHDVLSVGPSVDELTVRNLRFGDGTEQKSSIHTHPELQSQIDGRELSGNKGQPNGYAALDNMGKIPATQVPAFAITDTYPVASEAEMLALDAEKGDVCIRADLSKTFILLNEDPSVLANWQELLSPPNLVMSVNGKAGAVQLNAGDVGLGNVDNTCDLDKPISTLTQGALDLKAANGANTDIISLKGLANGTAATPSIAFSSDPSTGMYRPGAGRLSFAAGGTPLFGVGNNYLQIYGSSPSLQFGSSADLFLQREAANTLALRNGVNPQTVELYNTYTDASNYERASLRWTSNIFQIGTEKSGTGGGRGLYLASASGTVVLNACCLMFSSDNIKSIGNPADSRPANIYAGTKVEAPIINATTEVQVAGVPQAKVVAAVSLTNQTASIANNPIFIPTEEGTFRVSVYVRPVTAGISGQVQTNIGWNNGSYSRSVATTALGLTTLNGDATLSVILHSAANSPITYVTNASNLNGSAYGIDVVVEQLQ